METAHIISALDYLQYPLAKGSNPFDELSSVSAISPNQLQTRETPYQLRKDESGAVSVLDIGRVNNNSEYQPERIYDDVPLATIDFLPSIVTAKPPFSVVFTLWLSTIAALGDISRPSFFRTCSCST